MGSMFSSAKPLPHADSRDLMRSSLRTDGTSVNVSGSHRPRSLTQIACSPLRSRLATAALVVLVLAGCGGSSRLVRAAETIALQVGSNADDVTRAFRARFSQASDDELAALLERAATRTAWVDDAAARLVEAERARRARVVHSAACDWIAVSEVLGSASEEERAQAFEDIVVRHLELEGAAATRAQINEVWDIAHDQIVSLQTTGSLSEQELLTDLACVL